MNYVYRALVFKESTCHHVYNLWLEVSTWNEINVNQKDIFTSNQALGNVSKLVDRIKVLKMKMNNYRIFFVLNAAGGLVLASRAMCQS